MSTATKKMNGTSKKQTSKKSGKIVGNSPKIKERGKSFSTGFEMPEIDKKIAEKQASKKQEPKKDCVDEVKEKLIKEITAFTIDNNDVVQDYLEIPLLDKCIPNFDTDFRMFFARAKDYLPYAAADNPRNQVFSETAKSVLRTAVYRPERYLSFTSSFCIAVCNEYEIEKRGNVEYLILKGNVQVTDSATRCLLLEHMRRNGNFEENLERMTIPFSVKLRKNYNNDVEFAQACTAQNTSKPLTAYERAYGFGCFDSVPARFGKYADMIALKECQAKNGKVYLKDMFSYIGSQDCTKYVNAMSLNNDTLSHCAKEVYTTSVFNEIISEKEKHLEMFNADYYFGYIDDIGETFFELYKYLSEEFLNDLLYCVNDKESSITGDKFAVFIAGNYSENRSVYKWNASTLRMIYNCLRYLIREDETGKEHYMCNPIKLLKNKLFMVQLTNCLYGKLTIGVEMFENDKRIKKSSIESREAAQAEAVYNEMKIYIDSLEELGVLNTLK